MSRFKQMFREHKKGFISSAICALVALIAIPTLAITIGTPEDHEIYAIVASGSRDDGINDGYWNYITYYKESADGTPAYCLNADRAQPTGQDYTENGTISDRLYTILMNGYPNKRFSNNSDADFYITQIAIWHELGQLSHGEPIRWVTTDACNLSSDELKAAYENLISLPDSAPQTTNIAVNFAKKDYTATRDKALNSYVTEPITLKLDGNITSCDLEVRLENDSNPNTGAYLINSAGDKVTRINSNDSVRVVIPESEPVGTISLTADGTVIHKVGITFTTQDKTYQDVGMVKEKSVEASVADIAKVTWTKVKGGIAITKMDADTRNKLAGAKFSLWQGTKKIMDATTTSKGIAAFEGLALGKYTLKEDKPAVGYLPTDQTWEVNVTDAGSTTVKLDIENKPIKFMLKVVKVDGDTKEPLKGARFKLYKDGSEEPMSFNYELNGEKVKADVFESNEKGELVFPEALLLGKYKLVEVEVPQGYKAIDPIEFEVTPDTKLDETTEIPYYTIEVNNFPGSGELEITKKDISTGELLPNAHFAIYAEDGTTIVDKGVTDENGIAKFILPCGKYFYQEFEAPEGYQIDSSLFPFEIKNDGDIVKCEMTNTKLPKTGDLNRNFIIPTTVVLGLGAVFLIVRRYKKNQK